MRSSHHATIIKTPDVHIRNAKTDPNPPNTKLDPQEARNPNARQGNANS